MTTFVPAGTFVPAAGLYGDVLLVGEAPGKHEAAQGKPFVGPSGREQERYLARHGVSVHEMRRANVVPIHVPGNPDPTAAQIREWEDFLLAEIEQCQPKIVIAVGAFASRWFLGSRATVEACHGIPHHVGTLAAGNADQQHACKIDRIAAGLIVVPVTHPAAGLRDPEARAVIAWDYGQAAAYIKRVKRRQAIETAQDDYVGMERYKDVSGRRLVEAIRAEGRIGSAIGIDTETLPDGRPWSIQVSVQPGTGYMLRASRDDLTVGVTALQEALDGGATAVLHNAMFDIGVCRALGLDLSNSHIRIRDTMYAAYLLRLEPQGLKPLAWRWCGMKMQSYTEAVAGAGEERQVAYLADVLDRQWPTVEPTVELSNDGTAKVRHPWTGHRRAERILRDYYLAGGPGGDVDLVARWAAVDEPVRRPIEDTLGPFPRPSLADVPLDTATAYAVRDADSTLRLYRALEPVLREAGLDTLMERGMMVLPVFEEMQATGMVASRSRFADTAIEMQRGLVRLQSQISHNYFDDRPFNPASSKQVATLLRRRGLQAAKRTPTGQASTSSLSIAHLADDDPAVSLVMEWREQQKVLTAFCNPALERLDPSGPDLQVVTCQIKPTRVHTRRLAAANPNLLQVPPRIRECYVAPEGEVYYSADLSLIEIRVAAHLSRDELLCRLLTEGVDIHTETASRIFGIPADRVDAKEHRTPAKRASFAAMYGVHGEGLLAQLRAMGCRGWTVERCNALLKEWFEVYYGVADEIKRTTFQVRRDGYVRDMWGMVRYLPGVWVPGKLQAEAERQAFNHRVQGGAQGMIQNSMAWLRPRIRDMQARGTVVRWCLQIHDELVFQVDEGAVEALDQVVREALTQHHGVRDFRVPVEASSRWGQSWADLK